MSGIARPMLDILEKVKQVWLRHPVLAQGFDHVQVFGTRFGLQR